MDKMQQAYEQGVKDALEKVGGFKLKNPIKHFITEPLQDFSNWRKFFHKPNWGGVTEKGKEIFESPMFDLDKVRSKVDTIRKLKALPNAPEFVSKVDNNLLDVIDNAIKIDLSKPIKDPALLSQARDFLSKDDLGMFENLTNPFINKALETGSKQQYGSGLFNIAKRPLQLASGIGTGYKVYDATRMTDREGLLEKLRIRQPKRKYERWLDKLKTYL